MFAIQTGQPPGGGDGGGAGLTSEEVMDLIASTLVAGANVTIVYDDAANTITISATGGGGGLDAEAVTDLLGASIVAGAGISVAFNDAANTVTITNTNPDTGAPPTVENIQDIIGATLVAGTNVTITYDDVANTLTINATGGTGGGLDAEQVQDVVGAMVVAGAGIGLNYNDAANTLTITNTAPDTGVPTPPPTTEQIQDIVAGMLVAGANVTLTYDDVGNTLTIAATGGGGGLDAEAVTDLIGSSVLGSASITATFSDAANTVVLTIPARGVTPAIHFALATRKVLARLTAGSGDVEQLDPEQILDMISNTHGQILFRGSAVWFGLATSTPGYVLTTQGPGQNPIWNEALASLGVAARGDIIYRGASAWLRLAAGATGRVLTTKGAGADPSWDPPSGGGAVAYPYAHKNRIRNGNFFSDYIANGAAVGLPSGSYGPDYWIGTQAGSGVYTKQRVADPDDATKFALKVAVTTAAGSIGAGDAYTIYQIIEGFDIADLLVGTAGAKKIAISFDMKFSVTGNYGVSIRNSAANRGYVGIVTQTVANATESKTVLLTLDTTGSWLNNGPGVGMYVGFCLAAGVNLQVGSPNNWFGANIIAPTSQVNFLSSTSNIGYLKNFQLERGAVATAFDEGRSDGLVPVEEVQVRSQPFRNRFNNGNFLVDQIREGAQYTFAAGAGGMAIDGVSITCLGTTGTLGVVRSFALGLAEPAMQFSAPGAQAVMAAGDLYSIHLSIEGNDIADLKAGTANAEYVTISFEVQSNVLGIYGLRLSNADNSRYYITAFTIFQAGVVEFKKITLKLDTTGNWFYDNRSGLNFVITLACGTNWIGTVGSWGVNDGTKVTIAGQVNLMSSSSNSFYLKNFQVEKGVHATPFERVSYQQQLARCQRYYEKSFNQGVAVAQASATAAGGSGYHVDRPGAGIPRLINVNFSVVKRAVPTITFYNPVSATPNWFNSTLGIDSGGSGAVNAGTSGFNPQNIQLATDTINHHIYIHWSVNARLS